MPELSAADLSNLYQLRHTHICTHKWWWWHRWIEPNQANLQCTGSGSADSADGMKSLLVEHMRTELAWNPWGSDPCDSTNCWSNLSWLWSQNEAASLVSIVAPLVVWYCYLSSMWPFAVCVFLLRRYVLCLIMQEHNQSCIYSNQVWMRRLFVKWIETIYVGYELSQAFSQSFTNNTLSSAMKKSPNITRRRHRSRLHLTIRCRSTNSFRCGIAGIS